MKIIIFSILLYSFFLSPVHALMEVSGNFSYKKQVYGDRRQNKAVERDYETSLAFYLFEYTGIEFNYSYEQDIINENDQIIDSESGITIESKEGRVNTRSYGSGLRQAFSSPMAFIVPTLAVGYAYQIKSGGVSYKLLNNGEEVYLYFPYAESRGDAVFGVFSLKLRPTKFFSINGSVKTVFEAFEWNKAKDDLRYQVGFSWYL